MQHEKARAVLVGQWGFGAGGDLSGTTCLFSGPPGTGKTLAAEAVGYETGRPLKVGERTRVHFVAWLRFGMCACRLVFGGSSRPVGRGLVATLLCSLLHVGEASRGNK